MQGVPDPPEMASRAGTVLRLSENPHLPFEKLMALSKAEGPFDRLKVDAEQCRSIEGLRYPHPSSLRRTFMYASFLKISEASVPRAGSMTERDFAKLNLHMDIFHQPLRSWFFGSLILHCKISCCTLLSFLRKQESRQMLRS